MKPIALRIVRRRAGLTQQQLEDLSGIDRSRIARLETVDTNPTLDTYTKLDQALRRAENGLRRNEKLAFGPAVAAEERAAS
jgi:transcriptional regulator with XRE-family HTH domain